jgi:hypothetical protein
MADALAPSTTAVRPEAGHGRDGSWPLALGSVRVVDSDIVTSPHALKESLAAAAAGDVLTASPRQPERTSAAIRQR